MPNPQASDFEEWKNHPFTERYFSYLQLLVEAAQTDWAREHFVGDTLDQWALQNAKALGGVQALLGLLNLEMQDIIDAEKEAHEQVRNKGRRLDDSGQASGS